MADPFTLITRIVGDQKLSWVEVRYFMPIAAGASMEDAVSVFEDMAKDKGFEITRELPPEAEPEEFEPGLWTVGFNFQLNDARMEREEYELAVARISPEVIKPLHLTRVPVGVVFNFRPVQWDTSPEWHPIGQQIIVYRKGIAIYTGGQLQLPNTAASLAGDARIVLPRAAFMIQLNGVSFGVNL
jgi:hypothetical protein